MNWKNTGIALLSAALSFGALSANAQDGTQARNYMYGDHLDIAKVVSVNQASPAGCGVVNARMTYLDSAGKTQVMNYRTFAQDCRQDN